MKACPRMFMLVVFTAVRRQKQPKCPSVDDRVKMWSILTSMFWAPTGSRTVRCYICVFLLSRFSCVQLFSILWTVALPYSPRDSAITGILQARILECIAIPLSRGIFPTQGQNLHLSGFLPWQVGSSHWRHLGRCYLAVV